MSDNAASLRSAPPVAPGRVPPSGPASTSMAVISPELLHATHYQALVRAAALMVDDREQAEEVVQEAFTALVARWRTVDPERAAGYLYRSVTNGCRSALRRRRTVRRFIRDTAEPVPGADTAVLRAAGFEALLGAVAQLPMRQRQVLVLRFFSELSVADTAEALDIKPGAVAVATHHALNALRKLREDLS